MGNTKLSPPWVEYYNKLEAFFGQDPDITLEYDDEDHVISIYVEDDVKADALAELLPMEKKFGNESLIIEIIPANKEKSYIDFLQDALRGNPAFSQIIHVSDIFDMYYVLFKNEVVQYYDDALNDPHGNAYTLYQNLAKEIFEDIPIGINFTTEPKEK